MGMNKEFMSEFYDRFYEDCILETVGESKKMENCEKGVLKQRHT